jgi:hypothetical protein
MAITTLQGVKDGLKPPITAYKLSIAPNGSLGRFVTNFYAGGVPEAAAAPSPGLNGAALTSYAGQIPWQNPASGNAHLAGISGGVFPASFSGCGSILLMDRLWHNSSIAVTTTTQQSITFPTLPARDRNGSSNGDGVYIALEVSAATGNAGAITNTTISYTNSSGTSGRTGTIASFPATAAAGVVVPFELQAGDVGVRSVEGLTLGASYVSGTIHLVAYRPIAHWAVNFGDLDVEFLADAISLGLPRVYDNSVPYLVFAVSATHNTTAAAGMVLQVAHG